MQPDELSARRLTQRKHTIPGTQRRAGLAFASGITGHTILLPHSGKICEKSISPAISQRQLLGPIVPVFSVSFLCNEFQIENHLAKTDVTLVRENQSCERSPAPLPAIRRNLKRTSCVTITRSNAVASESSSSSGSLFVLSSVAARMSALPLAWRENRRSHGRCQPGAQVQWTWFIPTQNFDSIRGYARIG